MNRKYRTRPQQRQLESVTMLPEDVVREERMAALRKATDAIRTRPFTDQEWDNWLVHLGQIRLKKK